MDDLIPSTAHRFAVWWSLAAGVFSLWCVVLVCRLTQRFSRRRLATAVFTGSVAGLGIDRAIVWWNTGLQRSPTFWFEFWLVAMSLSSIWVAAEYARGVE